MAFFSVPSTKSESKVGTGVPLLEPFVQAIASVLDPVSGEYIAEEKDYTVAQTTSSGRRSQI